MARTVADPIHHDRAGKRPQASANPHPALGSLAHRILADFRPALWLGFLVLCTCLVLWPVNPSPTDAMPMQSTQAIQHLSWFVLVFLLWTAAGTALIVIVEQDVFACLALCLAFTVVFVQSWLFASPWGNSFDSDWYIGQVMYLQRMGSLPPAGHPAFTYFDFPGVQFIGVALSDLTGLEPFTAVRFYLLASGLALASILYLAFLRIVGTPIRAARGVILAIESSIVLGLVTNQYHNINLATVYIVTFFLLLSIRSSLWRGLDGAAVIIVLMSLAAVVGYMFTPVFFSTVLVSLHIFGRAARERPIVSLSMAMFPALLFLGWMMFMTIYSFNVNTGILPAIMFAFLNGRWLLAITQVLNGNLQPDYPWWGTINRLFWWTSVFGIGTLLLVYELRLFSRASNPKKVELAFFTGVVASVSLGVILTEGVVHGGLSRYIWLAPLSLAPAIIRLLDRQRAVVQVGLYAPAVLLLLPTFLSNAHLVSSQRAYLHEMAAGEFITSSFRQGDGITLFGFPAAPSITRYVYIPNVTYRSGGYLYGVYEEQEWRDLRTMVEDFAHGNGNDLMIDSPKGRTGYQERLNVRPDDQRWRNLEDIISTTNRVYDSGYLQLDSPSSIASPTP